MEARPINSRFSAILGAVALTLTYASVASAQIVRRSSSDAGLTVFANENFSGPSFTVRTDMPNFAAISLNDQISSFRVARNQRWEVCDAANYRGRCTIISGSESSLRSSGWENRISSARLVSFDDSRYDNPRYRRPARLVLYTEPNFRGRSLTLVDGESSLPGNMNRVRSVQVIGGTWQLCPDNRDRRPDNRNRGMDNRDRDRCVSLTSNVSNLNAIGIRGDIGSVRLIDRR